MQFPPTLVINLNLRKVRLSEFTQEFHNWPVTVERVSAVKYSPGWKGCAASHLKCIKLAKERNYPWVLIVEDDCTLTPGASEQFQALLPYLWQNKASWDIFYGGTTCINKAKHIFHSPPIFELRCLTTHFCLIHNASYDKILNNYPGLFKDYTKPIDMYYADTQRIWTTVPFFAKQRASMSDIQGRVEDYTDIFNQSEKKLLDL
jgi:GR25 family glycosyltransferase involved in LPS biosynthesis